jgi:hypothetical protein
MTKRPSTLDLLLTLAPAIAMLLILLAGPLVFGQTETSTIVTEGGADDAVGFFERGEVWAGIGAILGLIVRVLRLIKLRSFFRRSTARIIGLVMSGVVGVASALVTGDFMIAIEAIGATIAGIIAGEGVAAASRENVRDVADGTA